MFSRSAPVGVLNSYGTRSMREKTEYRIRTARPEDLDQIAAVEAACFPAAEAAGREQIRERLAAYRDSFLVAQLSKSDRIIGFINGAVTDERTISDEMFEDISLHNPRGAYQAIFGLDVVEEFRGQGIAADLMRTMIRRAGNQGRAGLILTCKERLIGFYEKLGYRLLGLSKSVHGGAVWYDMILEFKE